MPPTDKKLEKLQKLLDVANEDYATPDDVVKMSEALLGLVAKEKSRVESLLSENKTASSQEIRNIVSTLTEKENGLRAIITRLSTETNQAISDTQNTLSKEIKRVERKIPTRTDLTGLEREISAIKDALVTVPTEITANPEAVRDALELLPEGEKLAVGAIEDLRAILDELQRRPHGTVQGGGVRFLRYLSDVNIQGITNGQGIAWNATANRFEPATFGGGGAGSTYETPTGAVDGSNVTYTVTAIPKCIIYFGTTLFEGANGYSRSGLTITMPYAPTVSDQFKAVI